MKVDILFLLSLFINIEDCCQHTGLVMFQERIKFREHWESPAYFEPFESLFDYSCTKRFKHVYYVLMIWHGSLKGGSVTGKIQIFLLFPHKCYLAVFLFLGVANS